MHAVTLDDYYLSEQDEPTVRRRLGLDAPRVTRGRARAGLRPGTPSEPVVGPIVVVSRPSHDDRLPLVA